MAQTYLLFDFGSDEEKVQQARHKLEGWKQAFRLDKKLQYKLEREDGVEGAQGDLEAEPKSAPTEKSKSSKSKAKPKSSKSKSNESDASEDHGPVKLLVRLYFSGHEKLSEQRWIDRIPAEEPFKGASPKIVREDEPGFTEIIKQFDSLE